MKDFASVLVLAAIAFGAMTTMALAAPLPVPEPTSLALLGTGMGALFVVRKFRRRK